METPLTNDYLSSDSPPVGGRLCSFRRDCLKEKCSNNTLSIITNSYILPFITKAKLVRHPLILAGYKAHQKAPSLASCIQSLLSRSAIERVENVRSLGFYSHLFLVPKPRFNRWSQIYQNEYTSLFFSLATAPHSMIVKE